jgi:hypothetical protein
MARDKQLSPSAVKQVNRLQYIIPWGEIMLQKIYGIMGHRWMIKSESEIIPFQIILAAGALFMMLRISRDDLLGCAPVFLFLVLGYGAILMQVITYPNYLATGAIQLGVQGRYIFPVLVPLYVLLAFYLMKGLRKNFLQWPAAVAIAAFFICTEFPWFIQWVTPEWSF